MVKQRGVSIKEQRRIRCWWWQRDNLKLCPDLRPDIELKVTAAVDLLVHSNNRSKVVVEERDLMTHQ